MFPQHNPAQQTLDFICKLSGASEAHLTTAATQLRDHVRKVRKLYRQPVGGSFPYHDLYFQFAYLIAYFPYYIEPLTHVLTAANLPNDLFTNGNLKASFFGGGPGPEVLGLAAYLRERAPALEHVDVNVFDREPAWKIIQQVLLPDMLPGYASDRTGFSITSRQCNVVKCAAEVCACGVAGSDLVIAQNFLTEVYGDSARAIKTFEGLVRRSGCRYLVFVENNYPQTMDLMNAIAWHLYTQGLAVSPVQARTDSIRPNVLTPEVLIQHLYADEDGLRARKNVHYHHMVIEIAR